MSLQPRIYVACLEAYNNGVYHGVWIDATQDAETIWEEINQMLASSPFSGTEEWEIHDKEDFGYIELTYADIEDIIEIAKFIVEHDKLGIAVLEYNRGDLIKSKRLIENCYLGTYSSKEKYASEYINDYMNIPDNLALYIDYEMFARDLFTNDLFSIKDGIKIHVFTNY